MAADFSAKKSNFITRSIQAAEQILNAYYIMKQIQDSNADQEFLTPGSALNLSDSDFANENGQGENNHLDRQMFLDGLTKGLLPVITVIELTVGGNANDARENLRKLLRS